MKPLLILGAVLIVAGIAILVFGQFSFTSEETLLQVGDAELKTETTDTIPLPPIAGFAYEFGDSFLVPSLTAALALVVAAGLVSAPRFRHGRGR